MHHIISAGVTRCVAHHSAGRLRGARSRLSLALVASAVILLAPGSALAASVGGGAYALKADANLLVAPLSLGALPSVTLPAEGGGPFSESVLSANLAGVASVDAAKASTKGSSGQSFATSSASVLGASVASLVTVGAARSRCSTSRSGSDGSVSVVDLVVAGTPIATADLGPNTTIVLPVGRVIVNEQRRDGARNLAVNAVHVILDAVVVGGDVVIAQSRCTVGSEAASRRSSARARGKRTARVRAARARRAA